MVTVAKMTNCRLVKKAVVTVISSNTENKWSIENKTLYEI